MIVRRSRLLLIEGSKRPFVVKRLTKAGMLDRMVAGEMRGKHGSEWGEAEEKIRKLWDHRLKDSHYVLLSGVPMSRLSMEHDITGRYTDDKPSKAQERRVRRYAGMNVKFDPIYI